MGRNIQFFITLILLTISNLVYSQCDSILVIRTNNCIRYLVPEARFVDLFLARRNLDTLANKLDLLQSNYDSLNIKNDSIETNYKKQILTDSIEISTYKSNEITFKQSLSQCNKTLGDVDKENINLRMSNDRLKKRQIKMVGLGAVGVLVLEIAIKILLK